MAIECIPNLSIAGKTPLLMKLWDLDHSTKNSILGQQAGLVGKSTCQQATRIQAEGRERIESWGCPLTCTCMLARTCTGTKQVNTSLSYASVVCWAFPVPLDSGDLIRAQKTSSKHVSVLLTDLKHRFDLCLWRERNWYNLFSNVENYLWHL